MQHRPERLRDRERGGGAVVVGANGRHDRDLVRELGQELEGVGVGPVEVVDEQDAAVQGGGGRGDDLGAGAGQRDAARALQREVGHPPQGLHRAAERGPAAELRAHRVQHRRLANSCLTDQGARVSPTHEIEDGPDLLVAADEHGRRVVSPSASEPEENLHGDGRNWGCRPIHMLGACIRSRGGRGAARTGRRTAGVAPLTIVCRKCGVHMVLGRLNFARPERSVLVLSGLGRRRRTHAPRASLPPAPSSP